MKTLLTCNLSSKTILAGATEWAPPVFSFGESVTLALRFQAALNGATIEPELDIRGLTAAVGLIDARPASGSFALQVGPGPRTADNTTAPLPHDCTPAALAAAINAKSAVTTAYGPAAVTKAAGSWLLVFGSGATEVPLRVVANKLFPLCLGRATAAPVDGQWIHELRLIQLPVAFTDSSERILPPAPTVTRVRAGGSAGDYSWNEIQSLYVSPDFRATFSLKKGYARTGQLDRTDDAESIQAALVAVLGDNVTVSNVAPYTAHIEFTGDLAGTAIDLLEVLPLNPPPGDLTFTLQFNRAALLAWLRVEESVTLPMEVRLLTADADEVISEQVAFSRDITIQRPLIFPELAETPDVDWLRPPSPRDYIPFATGNVITGHQFFRATVGDAAATEFVLAHGLATDAVCVFVRENTSGGRQLVDGTDFTVVITDADSVTVTALVSPPAIDAWAVVVFSAQTVAAFADGLEVTIGQVTGLDDRLSSMEDSLAEVLALIPSTPLGTSSTAAAGSMTIDIPAWTDLFPGRPDRTSSGSIDLSILPRPGGLLPAIHDASITSIPGAIPDVAASAGGVFQNDTGGSILVPGGLGTRSSYLPADGFLGSDGRRWYPLSRAAASTSFFPRDFERELFMFEVNSRMLRAGTTLVLSFKLALQLLQATTRAQYRLVIEHGTAPSQSSPATTSANLQDIAWDATPLLTQRVILGPNKVTHQFGVEILRSGAGVLSANKLLYGFATAADSVPASADVALRARLIDFDTENSVSAAKGTVFLQLSDASASIQ